MVTQNTTHQLDVNDLHTYAARASSALHVGFNIEDPYQRMIIATAAILVENVTSKLSETNPTTPEELDLAIEEAFYTPVLAHLRSVQEQYQLVPFPEEAPADQVEKFVNAILDFCDTLEQYAWGGEDVMGILFTECGRTQKKSDLGQVFTPPHITNLICETLNIEPDDNVLDAACGTGAFLTVANAKYSHNTYGVEYHPIIHALTQANIYLAGGNPDNIILGDSQTEEVSKWITDQNITKVIMNPPYENKYGCLNIVENVLNSVPAGTQCAFILPNTKLESGAPTLVKRILKNNRVTQILRLPDDIFYKASVRASIFYITAGEPQGDNEIITHHLADDGHKTVFRKGRQDPDGNWKLLEPHWVKVLTGKTTDKSTETINPAGHLSWQTPRPEITVTYEDFYKKAVAYLEFIHTENNRTHDAQ